MSVCMREMYILPVMATAFASLMASVFRVRAITVYCMSSLTHEH